MDEETGSAIGLCSFVGSESQADRAALLTLKAREMDLPLSSRNRAEFGNRLVLRLIPPGAEAGIADTLKLTTSGEVAVLLVVGPHQDSHGLKQWQWSFLQ